MKVKTVFQFIRLVVKLVSCIMYIAQTVSNENERENEYVYPKWCCQNRPIALIKDFTVPSINIVLDKVISNNDICPSKYTYIYTSLNRTFPGSSSYKHWDAPGVCHRSNILNSSCNCSFVCETHHVCANIGHVQNRNISHTECKFDEAALDQSVSFLLKFIFYSKSERIWIVQCVFGILDMLGAIISAVILYSSSRNCVNFLDVYNLIDIALGLMFTATILFPPCLKNIYIPTFLQSIHSVSIISLLVLEVDTFTTHRRWFTYNIQKSVSMVLNVLAFLFVCICAVEYVERVQVGNRVDSQPKNLAEATYLLLITLTTVGYGDFSPGTWFGRALIIVIISAVLLYLPGIIEEMLDTFKESGTYSKSVHSLYASKYIVVCLSNPTSHFMFDFLNEVYAENSSRLGTVILSPRISDRMIRTRLKSPVWRKRVLLLTGSALKSVDLERAGIEKCSACFIISDRQSYDPDASDQETILRAYSIHSFAPACNIYTYLLKIENKPLVSFARNIVCEGELKHAIFAASCVCPGFSTYISLLLHTTSSPPVGENALYNFCSGNEIYDIVLRDSNLLRDMLGMNFLRAALLIHKKYGILIIAVQKHGSKDILLNPADKVILELEDRIFYISQTNEENKKGMEEMRREMQLIVSENTFKLKNTSMEESRETEGTDFTNTTWTTLTTSPSDSSNTNLLQNPSSIERGRKWHLEETERTMEYSTKYKEMSVSKNRVRLGGFTFSGYKAKSELVPIRKQKVMATKRIAPTPKLQRSFRIVEDENIPEDSNNVPSHQESISFSGIPKQSLFMLPTGNRYHIIRPSSLCCLQIGWKYSCHEQTLGIPVAKKLNPPFEQQLYLYHHSFESAIIVIADEAGPQLYNFILPLRAAHIPIQTLHPIVLLLTSHPANQFLEAISYFPKIKFMFGNPNNVEDLLIAGLVSARLVILCLGDGTPTEKEEQHMTDATKIQTFIKFQQLFPSTRFLVEIFHRSNMEILCSKRNKSTNLNGFLTTPHFMSGQVFSPSLLDTILYQSVEKEYIIRLVRIMLGLEQGAGNRSLTSVSRNDPELRDLQYYGDIMNHIAKEWGMLAIGIYHCEYLGKKEVEILDDYKTNVAPFINEKLLCMRHNLTKGRDVETSNYAYKVLVNPIANIYVNERDVILTIKSTDNSKPDHSTGHACPSNSLYEMPMESLELTEVVEEIAPLNEEIM